MTVCADNIWQNITTKADKYLGLIEIDTRASEEWS